MLKGQKLAVIGGTGSLGSHFLARATELGADCAVLSPTRPAAGRFYSCNITKLDELEKTVEAVSNDMGAVDTVVNFAGTHHAPMDFFKDDPSDLLREFRRVLDVNLIGAFLVTALFARRMIPARHGHIIHLCSNGSRLSLYGSYAYNASKHGLEGLIKTAAAQLAPFGVRVNGVAPGTVETALNRDLLRDSAGNYSARAASILAHTPTKKFGTLDGVTETIVAMCLPQRHLTGNVVFCDDGYNIEGHSWPVGNRALFEGPESLENLMRTLDRDYPRDQEK
jgi:3-oxoacyl-[acyl-carrier protein] reductase